jgi:Flp pilus assembly protein TadG
MKLIKHLQDKKLQRGQSLVEMTIGFLLLLLILSGLLDLGRVYFIRVALEDSAGEGALYLSLHPECRTASDGVQCQDPNNAEYRARNASNGYVDWSTAEVTIERPAIYGVGETVRVTITYQFPLLTPVIPRIAGVNPLTLNNTATQVIISDGATVSR